MLTTQILVKNNEDTIEKCLNSVEDASSKIIIGDLGCDDKTIDICKKYKKIEIIKLKNIKNYSEIRNELSSEFNFLINPWEYLAQGQDLIKQESCHVYILQNNIISKDLRFWTKEKFKNPAYETIESETQNQNPNIIIVSKNPKDDLKEKEKILIEWQKEKPFNLDVYYYLACCYLSMRNYEKFIINSNEYFLRENKINISYIMMKYYSAQVCLFRNEIEKSIMDITECLVHRPQMSEFWCFLGDIYYKILEYKKSISFYENAKIIGKKRKSDDFYPIEIKKYKEYPEKMIKNIEEIIKKPYLIH